MLVLLANEFVPMPVGCLHVDRRVPRATQGVKIFGWQPSGVSVDIRWPDWTLTAIRILFLEYPFGYWDARLHFVSFALGGRCIAICGGGVRKRLLDVLCPNSEGIRI